MALKNITKKWSIPVKKGTGYTAVFNQFRVKSNCSLKNKKFFIPFLKEGDKGAVV